MRFFNKNKINQTNKNEKRQITDSNTSKLAFTLEEKEYIAIKRNPIDLNVEIPIKGESKKIGLLRVKNEGKNDAIWDIDFKVQSNYFRKFEKNSYHINELKPQEEWKQEYAWEDRTTTSIPISFKEEIKVINNEESNSVNNMDIYLILNLQSNCDLKNFKFSGKIAEFCSGNDVVDLSQGEANLTENVIEWEVPFLKNSVNCNLRIGCKINNQMLDVEKFKDIEIEFVREEYKNLSFLDIHDISALVKNFSYIESNELGDQPNNWACRFFFQNTSEFSILINRVMLKKDNSIVIDEKYDNLKEGLIIPEKIWKSKEFTIFSKEIPKFEKNIDFTVESELIYQSIISISIKNC